MLLSLGTHLNLIILRLVIRLKMSPPLEGETSWQTIPMLKMSPPLEGETSWQTMHGGGPSDVTHRAIPLPRIISIGKGGFDTRLHGNPSRADSYADPDSGSY
ncbi:hypothetical protein JTE90_007813 [Oedothorax gibbosus]|uniref:Uncharacterized protein n=1 Tax=Oedothorax gibbosus TaxID=931172 RepID=A0AAV6VJ23_9ARAC|nr:hypothetical protein JTE90_007813 [Oedothorax gibbosus]